MSGWAFLGFTALICIGVFLNGLRFARASKNSLEGMKLFGMPVSGSDLSVEQLRWIGRAQMIFAPIFLLIAALMMFGVFGPVENVETIEL